MAANNQIATTSRRGGLIGAPLAVAIAALPAYAVIPGAAHSVAIGYAPAGIWHAVREFLTMPKTV